MSIFSSFIHPTSASRRRWQRASLGCVGLALLSACWDYLPLVSKLEQVLIDYRYSHFNRDTRASDQVLVIDIDDSSLKLLGPHFGRWPWPRSVYKPLIEFLAQGEPAGIFFDLLFTESSQSQSQWATPSSEKPGSPDHPANSPAPVLKAPEPPDDDSILAEASAAAGIVSHAMLVSTQASVELGGETPGKKSGRAAEAEVKALVPLPAGLNEKFAFKWTGAAPVSKNREFYRDFNLPAPVILEKTPRLHVVTSEKDSDGIYRRAPVFFQYDQTWLPSLTLSAVLLKIKNPRVSANSDGWNSSLKRLSLQGDSGLNWRIPLDSKQMLPLHFYRPDRDVEIVPIAAALSSASQLQSGEVSDFAQLQLNPLTLKDKIIIIGASAEGLYDLKSTPVSASYPGTLIHATAISNILSQDFLVSIPGGFQFLLTVFTLLLVYFSIFLLPSVVSKVLVPLVWMGSYTAFSFYLFQKQSLALELARPLLLGSCAIFDGLTYLVFVEGKDKKKLKETLSKYLAPAISDQIIAQGKDPRAEVGQLKELSVLFSDIRGFTSISEKLEPHQLVALLNEYLGKMTDIIFEEMGTLDKFIGDAIMAFWGAPVSDPDHALKSLRCAIKMKNALDQLNIQWKSHGIQTLNMGIAISTGDVIVGNIGSEKRLDYTVIGDNVNFASRLEGLTKYYGVAILIGHRTEESVRNSYVCRPIDFVAVKGKEQCVRIYEPLGERSSVDAPLFTEMAERFSKALVEYQQGRFKQALDHFRDIERDWKSLGGRFTASDPVTTLFIERCTHFIVNPPAADWSGVFVALDK